MTSNAWKPCGARKARCSAPGQSAAPCGTLPTSRKSGSRTCGRNSTSTPSTAARQAGTSRRPSTRPWATTRPCAWWATVPDTAGSSTPWAQRAKSTTTSTTAAASAGARPCCGNPRRTSRSRPGWSIRASTWTASTAKNFSTCSPTRIPPRGPACSLGSGNNSCCGKRPLKTRRCCSTIPSNGARTTASKRPTSPATPSATCWSAGTPVRWPAVWRLTSDCPLQRCSSRPTCGTPPSWSR